MILILLVLGLVAGSFANAAIWRLHAQAERHHAKKKSNVRADADLSILTGRSMCTHCGHLLSAVDLIPVVSYLSLRGKCRYCGKTIEDTPVAELLTAALFVGSYLWWPYDLMNAALPEVRVLFAFWLVFLVGFVILALYDLRWMLLPDRVVFPLIALALAQIIVLGFIAHSGWNALAVSAFWGVVPTAGLFYILYIVSRQQWIGFGDVKLAIILGILTGGPLPALLMLFVASLLGSLSAIPLLLRGRRALGLRVPFGPYLIAATVVVVLFGGPIIHWYTSLLHANLPVLCMTPGVCEAGSR